MANTKAEYNLIQTTITSMSKDNFDELVSIFQKSYWGNDMVNVDGSNDGGCDIKIFKNKRELNKCVQVTVQKQGIESKIKNDLKKVYSKINDYGYSNLFEFYYSRPLSEEKIEEYKKIALEEYNIILEIYEAKRLSQLDCKEVVDFIHSLYPNFVKNSEQMNIDKATRTLYDLLANGKDSSDIKNSLVDSVIISILYEKAPVDITELKCELERRLGKNIPDILHSINALKSDQRVVKFKDDPKLLCLSEQEYSNVKEILIISSKLEHNFYDSLKDILSNYGITYNEDIITKLKDLYKNNYSRDFEMFSKNDECASVKIFDSFRKYLLSLIDDNNKIDLLINDIKELCSVNSYLNKIIAGESFLSLYKSNKLERYINRKQKDIYLDTPTFVYLLCTYYGIESNDWDNSFYRSMKSLIKLQSIYPDKINFFITQNYLGEVAGEIKKALQYAQFESFSFFKDMGGTSNTLFNYYEYLKKNDLFEKDENIQCFEDFIYNLGLDNVNVNDVGFIKDTINYLYEVADNFNITIVNWSQNEKYSEFKTLYEKILLTKGKEKSKTAICNDINQVIASLEHEKNSDCYLTTWDTTIYLLRDKILYDYDCRTYSYFNICNPARLSNKIALENFNIDESALTNDIFAYADKRYDISNRVKSLLELLAPFFKKDSAGDNTLLRKLGRMRKQQLEIHEVDNIKGKEENNLPIEEIVMLLIPDNDKMKCDEHIMDKFSVFMNTENNANYIIDLINQMSESNDFKKFDLTEYYKKVSSIII